MTEAETRTRVANPFFQNAEGVEPRVAAFYKKLGDAQVDFIRRDLAAFGYDKIFDLTQLSGFVAAVKDMQKHNLHVKDDGMWGLNTQRAFDVFSGPNYMLSKFKKKESEFVQANFKKEERVVELKADPRVEAAEKAFVSFMKTLPTNSKELVRSIYAPVEVYSDIHKTATLGMGYEYTLDLEIPGKKERLRISLSSTKPLNTVGQVMQLAKDLAEGSGYGEIGHIVSMNIVSGNKQFAGFSFNSVNPDSAFSEFAMQFYALTSSKKPFGQKSG